MDNKLDIETAHKVVAFLNDLLEYDRPAVAALIANRVPCNKKMAEHPTVQVNAQHGGYHVGLLGILNGLCGAKENGWGLITAHFDDAPKSGFNKLSKFIVDESIPENK